MKTRMVTVPTSEIVLGIRSSVHTLDLAEPSPQEPFKKQQPASPSLLLVSKRPIFQKTDAQSKQQDVGVQVTTGGSWSIREMRKGEARRGEVSCPEYTARGRSGTGT